MKKILLMFVGILCSLVTMADEYTVDFNSSAITQSTAGYFTAAKGTSAIGYKSKLSVTYNGTTYTTGCKMESATTITFTTSETASVKIIQGSNQATANIKFDGETSTGTKDSDGNPIHTFTGLEAGEHTISRGSGETTILRVEVVEEASTKPSLRISPNSASVNAFPFDLTPSAKFTLAGQNLTAGKTVDLKFASNVTGLSVSPSSVTIAQDGTVNQEVTINYAPIADIDASSVNLVASSNEDKVNATLAVNYSAQVTPYTMQSISEATTFALKNVGTLTATVTPDDYVLLSNAGATCAFANNIAVKGVGSLNVTWRSDAVQAGFFKFNTTVPGTVTVKFSDVGSSSGRANRYANVNGTRSTVKTNSSSTTVTTSAIPVNAGEVIIKGELEGESYTDSQIRVYEIVFTPATSVSVPVNSTGISSFCSDVALDFTGVESIEAYAVTEVGATSVKLTKVEKVAAGEGIFVKGTTTDVPVATEAVEKNADNLLVGTTEPKAIVSASENIYALAASDGKVHPVTSGTIAKGKAYLVIESPVKGGLSLVFDDDATAADMVKAAQEKVAAKKFMKKGQLLIQTPNGLVNAAGAQVK